ncbi:MAG: winged helix-turn-helix domain-containing protein [Candidatus Njordarchaeales archaeon]
MEIRKGVFKIIRIIGDKGEAYVREIIRNTKMSSATVVKRLRELEIDGYVTSYRKCRRKYYKLTGKGQKLYIMTKIFGYIF